MKPKLRKVFKLHATFSYNEYIKILHKFRPIICDFTEIGNKETFALLRHDVEFSLPRALTIAGLDSKNRIKSSFLFQTKSDAYNIFSNQNISIIREINNFGHYVGLHFYVSHIKEGDWETLLIELSDQRKVFELATQLTIDRFSFHRPPRWVLEKRVDSICGLINMYGPSYFELQDNPEKIKYLADSKHRFSYGHPLEQMHFTKYQILLHPDEWSEIGLQEAENFTSLIDETLTSFKDTLNSETKNFAKYYRS